MSNAPYCPVSRSQPTQDHRRLPRPHTDITHVPPVHDLRTAINAINQMNNIVQMITRGAPQVNNTRFPNEQQDPPPQYERLTWEEISRNYTQSKVVNPDDPDQVVEIKVITQVVWQETATGHQLVYEGQGST